MEKPETIKHAALLWVIAILAGVIETVLAVSAVGPRRAQRLPEAKNATSVNAPR